MTVLIEEGPGIGRSRIRIKTNSESIEWINETNELCETCTCEVTSNLCSGVWFKSFRHIHTHTATTLHVLHIPYLYYTSSSVRMPLCWPWIKYQTFSQYVKLRLFTAIAADAAGTAMQAINFYLKRRDRTTRKHRTQGECWRWRWQRSNG